MQPSTPKIGQAQWVHVARVIADPLFKEGSTHRVLFEYLATKTRDEVGFEQRRVEQVARDFYGTSTGREVTRFGVQKARLNKRLQKYYQSSGRNDRILLSLSPVSCYVGWLAKPEAAPLLSWPRLFGDDNTVPITMSVFKEFLEQHSNAEGTTLAERDSLVKSWVTPQDKYPGSARSGMDAFFDYLNTNGKSLTFGEMRELAEAIGIHRIMLDPLLSKPVREDCLVLRLPTTTTPIRKPSDQTEEPPHCARGDFGTTASRDPHDPMGLAHSEDHYGSLTVYGVPSKKLADTDAAFVFLYLAPGGQSTSHHHPGDELILLLHGTVSVAFEDSGLTCELTKGSFAHFYAEQNHSVVNTSSAEAQLFIIRFYQFDVQHTRQAMRQELWNKLDGPRPAAPPELDDLTWGWIINSAADRSIKQPLPAEVLNRFGLARFLKRSGAPRDPTAVRRFVTKLNDDDTRQPSREGKTHPGYSNLDQWLWDLETNQVALSRPRWTPKTGH
jgi:quercetin dioxygenase-like cupin family protein